MGHYNLVHNFPFAAGCKDPGCEGSRGEGMEQSRRNISVAVEQCEEQKGGHPRGRRKTKGKGHFVTLMDICHLKNFELEPK